MSRQTVEEFLNAGGKVKKCPIVRFLKRPDGIADGIYPRPALTRRSRFEIHRKLSGGKEVRPTRTDRYSSE